MSDICSKDGRRFTFLPFEDFSHLADGCGIRPTSVCLGTLARACVRISCLAILSSARAGKFILRNAEYLHARLLKGARFVVNIQVLQVVSSVRNESMRHYPSLFGSHMIS